MRKIEQIAISAADRERLERLVRNRNTAQKVVWRARIVLLASDEAQLSRSMTSSCSVAISCARPTMSGSLMTEMWSNQGYAWIHGRCLRSVNALRQTTITVAVITGSSPPLTADTAIRQLGATSQKGVPIGLQ